MTMHSLRTPSACMLIAVLAAGCSTQAPMTQPPSSATAPRPIVGLITKTATNPFMAKMREGAEAAARAEGMTLIYAAGRSDNDNISQVQALESMVIAGARTVLITPADAQAIVPAVSKARAAGVQVIALDNPTLPVDATDALIASDNYRAGVLAGRYAKAAMAGRPAVIATLDLFPGHPIGVQRHNGFMTGFGLPAAGASSNELSSDTAIVCMADTFGDRVKGQAAMASCLTRHPDINLVYTMNEPVAVGAHEALRAAGKKALIVSFDGHCSAIVDVANGKITATVQQYPRRMGETGVALAARYLKTGERATGYIESETALITATPMADLASRDVNAGLELCWGRR